jgi:excisionase family DNA binding protein
MQDTTLSTYEVAALLKVTETTIKRWADQSQLACVRTPGGHRKFLLNEVIRFAEAHGYQLNGLLQPPLTGDQLQNVEVGIVTKDYGKVAEVLLEEALQEDRPGLLSLLVYLYRHGVPFPVVADQIIRPAFEDLGALWAEGRLEVNQEHGASHALLEALIRFSPEMRRKPLNGLTALCACPEGELHDIGLQVLAYALEAEGWKVHYTGPDTPWETCAAFVRTGHPDVVCLSAALAHSKKSMTAKLRQFSSVARRQHAKLLVGGLAFANGKPDAFGADHVSDTVQDAIEWLRDIFELKPGPKGGRTVKEVGR